MRGQAAFEYLMMLSIVLAILSILTYYAEGMTESSRKDIVVSNAVIAVNKIAEAADIVYTQGNTSQITLSVYIPDNLQSIQIGSNTPGEFTKMMIMKIKVGNGFTDIIATSKANLTGNISVESGTKRIRIRSFVNTSGESYVNITQS
ncbi:MAG: hypothetical protein V1678_04560 [Candidatus Aenigmatarchaeota archaeon]